MNRSIANISARMTQAKATDQRSLGLFNRLKAKCGIHDVRLQYSLRPYFHINVGYRPPAFHPHCQLTLSCSSPYRTPNHSLCIVSRNTSSLSLFSHRLQSAYLLCQTLRKFSGIFLVIQTTGGSRCRRIPTSISTFRPPRMPMEPVSSRTPQRNSNLRATILFTSLSTNQIWAVFTWRRKNENAYLETYGGQTMSWFSKVSLISLGLS